MMSSDRALTQQISKRLTMRGMGAPCRVLVTARNGEVTLTGEVQYAHQRGAATKAAANIPGVRHVNDCLTVKARAKR